MEYHTREWSEKSFRLTCTFRTFCPALKAGSALRKSVHFGEINLHCFCTFRTFCPVFGSLRQDQDRPRAEIGGEWGAVYHNS